MMDSIDRPFNGSFPQSRPKFGQRLLINVIDETARTDPSREWLSISRSSNPKDGWKVITFKQLADAVNLAAHNFVATFGQALAGAFPTVAYIGHNDVRYVIFMFAMLKAGYKICIRSPFTSRYDPIISWPVNFNISVESFEPYIKGVRHLIDFTHNASKNAPIVFISSIGMVSHWSESGPVPESGLKDLNLPGNDYGRSKLVSNLILERATEQSNVPSAIIRVGQIAGPQGEKGAWNRQEWLPSIVASSVYLCMLPRDLGSMTMIDRIPVEGMAQFVLEVAGVTAPVPVADINGYFHGVNPATATWQDLVETIREFYGERIKETVSFERWMEALEDSRAATEDVNKNPGLKLLDMYNGLVTGAEAGAHQTGFDMPRTKNFSRTMREMKAVTPQLMKHWCEQWGF